MVETIETGVDKLIALIEKQDKISIKEASRELGVSKEVVEEWSDFLEEEGIISIQYKLATAYLVRRKLSKKDIEVKHKEFDGKKEGFIRQAEVMLSSIERDNKVCRKIKDEFDHLKEILGKNLSGMKIKLSELENYEKIKEGLDKDIKSHQEEIKKKVMEITIDIEREKKRYHDIILELKDEEVILRKDSDFADNLKNQEEILKKHMTAMKESIKKIEEGIKKEGKLIESSDSKIKKLKKKSEFSHKELLIKMNNLDLLLEDKKKKEEEIIKKESEIMFKASEDSKKIKMDEKEAKKISEAFSNFFNKKKKVQNLIESVNVDKEKLETELKELIKKATALSVSKQGGNFGKHAEDIKKKFDEVNNRKERYENGLKSLIRIFSDNKDDTPKKAEKKAHKEKKVKEKKSVRKK